jgi:hypothetical protein
MKKIFLFGGIGVLAFLIQSVISFFAYCPHYDLETSENVCQECLDYAKSGNVETKKLADLIENKEFFGKIFRVKAELNHDTGYIYLQDKERNIGYIPVTFDREKIDCAETEKTLRVCSGIDTWYDGGVKEITVIGYFGRINKEDNRGGKTEGFNIMCVEQVNATQEDLIYGKERFEKSRFSLIFD